MKKYIPFHAIILLAAGIFLTACKSSGGFNSIEASQAETIAAGKDITIIDVRTPEEFLAGHLPNALNIDFLHPSFEQKISALNRKKKYLVYCRSGHRSTQAVTAMKEKGFEQVTNMLGGFSQWKGPVSK